ncbi:MAG: 3-phosphoshikimate 1-carboxyvinyltransferase, partial [Chloroflexi bacterium]|nr:3-phosphoshikimate 1-carboxyvinyltransferase [Chloroflexota bacterium]
PSDKSIGHRALIANALACGEAVVELRHPGADVLATADALRHLGVELAVREGPDGRWTATIHGLATDGPERIGRVTLASAQLDCRNSGTSLRLLSGVAAGQEATFTLIGDESLSRRPMERIAVPLRRMGATVDTNDGRPPISVVGRRPLRALHHSLAVASAQVLGAISFAALVAEGTTTVTTPAPTRDHTERLLGWMGARIDRDGRTTTVRGPGGLRARSLVVPGDPSSAAFWLVAGAVHPDADLTIDGVSLNPTRTALIDVLREMGASIDMEPDALVDGPEPAGRLRVRSGERLRGITLHGDRVAELIDELPILAVAMATATGRSELRDAAELRHKESDRISLMVRNLDAIGAQVTETRDGWIISRGIPRNARIQTRGDHRIAMAFALAAVSGAAGTVEIDDPGCVAVSYASFWEDLATVSAAAGIPSPSAVSV